MLVYKISAKNEQSGDLGYVQRITRGYPYYSREGKEYKSQKSALNALTKCNEYKAMANDMYKNDDFEFKIEIINKGELK